MFHIVNYCSWQIFSNIWTGHEFSFPPTDRRGVSSRSARRFCGRTFRGTNRPSQNNPGPCWHPALHRPDAGVESAEPGKISRRFAESNGSVDRPTCPERVGATEAERKGSATLRARANAKRETHPAKPFPDRDRARSGVVWRAYARRARNTRAVGAKNRRTSGTNARRASRLSKIIAGCPAWPAQTPAFLDNGVLFATRHFAEKINSTYYSAFSVLLSRFDLFQTRLS